MTRIECNCKQCKTNAASIGLTAPLAVETTDLLLEQVGSDRRGIHCIVYNAYDPNIGRIFCQKTGTRKV